MRPIQRLALMTLLATLAACSTPTDAPTAKPAGTGAGGTASTPGTAAAAAAAAAADAAGRTPQAAPAPAAPPPVLPFDEAVLAAAHALMRHAQVSADTRHAVVIDPLIDGVTGAQTLATRALGVRLAKLVEEHYGSRFAMQPFSAKTVQAGPLVLIGTFTGVNGERKTEGRREAYRICLALADLKTGKLVGKGLAFAKADGVDASPLAYFRDAPVWTEDAATSGYIRTCQGTKAGDPIHPAYIDRIVTAATIAEAIDAYAAARYADALKLYETARDAPGGNQLRVHTGLYLTNLKLRRMPAARKAFGDVIDQGLDAQRLGVKFLFKPGTAALWVDPAAGPLPYPLWTNEIAARAARRQTCLEFGGHTSATGAEAFNERLSLLRAEAVRVQVAKDSPAPMRPRLSAKGYGSKMTLVGNGRDDLSDALDRRVELKVQPC